MYGIHTDDKSKRKSGKRRSKSGVGMVIGGVILVTILLTTVFAFFYSMLQNERARAEYQTQANQVDQEMALETFTVDREEGLVNIGGQNYIRIHIINEGSSPLRYSHVMLYCQSTVNATCASPAPTINPVSVAPIPPVTLNGGESSDDIAGSEDGI